MQWEYTQPVNLVFGNGSRKTLSSYLSKGRGLLITSPSFVKSMIAKEVMESSNGAIVALYGSVTANPDVEECRACAMYAKCEHIDFIVALGGGSVIDLAKAVSVMVVQDLDIMQWIQQPSTIPLQHVPVIAMPTTAGTGSEMTCVCVVSDHSMDKKIPLSSKSFYPSLAIVDPELTYSLSKHSSASTGFDVLSHAIEAYWSVHHQPICDALAIHAIKLVFTYLKQVNEDPTNVLAREKMAEASCIAGLAFTLPKTTAPHACSYPLTNLLGIPHGEACALTLPYFMRLHHIRGCERVQEIANLSGFSDVEDMVMEIEFLRQELGLQTDLRNYTIQVEQFEKLVMDSMNQTLQNNPIALTQADIREVFQTLLVE